MKKKNKKAPLFSFKYFLYDFTIFISVIPMSIFFRPKYVYEEKKCKKVKKGGMILLSNHNTFYDPIYSMVGIFYRRLHFVVTKELFKKKFASWFLRNVMAIEVDKENVSIKTLREMLEVVKRGQALAIYPEGFVNTESRKISDFKSGSVEIAYMTKAPIVVMYIGKRKHKFDRLRFMISKPIYLKDIGVNGKEDFYKANEYLKNKLMEFKRKMDPELED